MSKVIIFTGGKAPTKKDAFHWLVDIGSMWHSDCNITGDYIVDFDSSIECDSLINPDCIITDDSLIKADCIIAADSGFDTAYEWQITPDVVIGDMDSIVQKSELSKLPPDSIHKWPHDKDFTDTELALKEAVNFEEASRAGFCSVTKPDLFTILVGGDGGRIDHLFAIKQLFETNLFPNVWLCKSQAVICLESDTGIKAIKIEGLNEVDSISVFPIHINQTPITENSHIIKSESLLWPLEKVQWHKDEFSLSNRIVLNKNATNAEMKGSAFNENATNANKAASNNFATAKNDNANANNSVTNANVQISVLKGRFIVILPLHVKVHYNVI